MSAVCANTADSCCFTCSSPTYFLSPRLRSRSSGEADGESRGKGKLPIPWFAIGFLALAIVNSLNVLPPDAVTAIRKLDIFALTMAMTALGIETRFANIRKAGPRVMALGLILYAWLLVGGYGIVKLAS